VNTLLNSLVFMKATQLKYVSILVMCSCNTKGQARETEAEGEAAEEEVGRS